MSEGRWNDIFKHLTSKGFDVYPPSRHKGECTSRYIVVKVSQALRASALSSENQLYDILLYVPNDEYSMLEEFIARVKLAMKDLEPMIKYEWTQTTPYYDSSVNGHMVSMLYRNTRKL